MVQEEAWGKMVDSTIPSSLILHICHQLQLVVRFDHTGTITNRRVPDFMVYVASFIRYLQHHQVTYVKTGGLLAQSVILGRLRGKFIITPDMDNCTMHRVFVASLIITSKSLHDRSPKNKLWAKYTRHFTLHDINSMERRLLDLLDYQIIISTMEFYDAWVTYWSGVTPALRITPIQTCPPKVSVVESKPFHVSSKPLQAEYAEQENNQSHF